MLSTALLCGTLRDGSDTEVASPDDIHSPVENSENPGKPPPDDDDGVKKPPGEFVNDELEKQTKRFLQEVKDLARRRREAEDDVEPGPPPGPVQRSRRR